MLCVWAYIAQIRIDELQQSFGDKIILEPHFFHVFGFATEKLKHNWQDKGGIEAYDEHIHSVKSSFDHIEIQPNLWTNTQPKSSMPSHLLLCAVRYLENLEQIENGSLSTTMWKIRQRFFRDGLDISNSEVLLSIAKDLSLPTSSIKQVIDSGIAHAELSKDLLLAQNLHVEVSPTLIFNEGRQKLSGNVGYRVIEANIKELLLNPKAQNSWC